MNSFKQFSIVLFFVLLTSSTFAQKSGWSLLFSWDRFNAGENFLGTVYDYNNTGHNLGGIGVEYQMTSQVVLQVGLDLGISSQTQESGTSKTTFSGTEYGISLGPVWYVKGVSLTGVRPYLGAVVNIGGVSATTEVSSSTGTGKEELSASTFGFTAFGGADVQIIDGLRVGAGYGFMYASYPQATRKVTGGTEEKGPSASLLSDVFMLNCKLIF